MEFIKYLFVQNLNMESCILIKCDRFESGDSNDSSKEKSIE